MNVVSKKLIRKTILSYRKLLAEEEYVVRNQQVCSLLTKLIAELDIDVIHTFLPIERNHEPDVTALFDDLWSAQKKLIVSKTNFSEESLTHFFLEATTMLEVNHLRIPEPVDAKPASIEEVQMIFVPLILADKIGHRIGYGGGYYDKLLSETNCVKVGLSLSLPVDEIIQSEDWDVPLDFLVTPNKLYKHG